MDASNFNNLLNQVRWITRISSALSSAIDVEDVYSVLLSGLMSPLGLSYSQALIFDVDKTGKRIHGRLAMRIHSMEEMIEIRSELIDEFQYWESKREQHRGHDADDDSAIEELRMLELGAQWITVFQRIGTDENLTDVLSDLELSLADGDELGLMSKIAHRKAPFVVRPENGTTIIPRELALLLPEEFAVVPLRTNRGLRAVLFLDRRLTEDQIGTPEIESLEWFATQGALALQNAELIQEMDNANKELKAVDSLKSNFLSIISHELRTPLTAMTGFIELILGGKVGEITSAQRSLLARVSKNTGHLSNMVNDLIEIAEIKAEGMSDVVLSPVDPLDTLFGSLPNLEFRRRDQQVTVNPVFDGEIPMILCDVAALERIYFHLLDNAVKFSPVNDVVEVRFRQIETDSLEIAICDNGNGIPPDKLQRIFEEFYQIDNSLTRAHEGMGLGLAVTRILVQATKGDIKVESKIGKGSTFRLVYPVAGRTSPVD